MCAVKIDTVSGDQFSRLIDFRVQRDFALQDIEEFFAFMC